MRQNKSAGEDRVWAALPVYNNGSTLRAVVEGCRALLDHVLVVDDGSSDCDVSGLLADLDITVLKHERNLGKGQAILTASRYIEAQGGAYMITIDTDGQHDPADLKEFLPLLAEDGSRLVIGSRDFTAINVPFSSKFGRAFANFWLRAETGIVVNDCQSGFRAYPVRHLNRLNFKGARYDFEAEVLAKAAWAGLELVTVPISVYYPTPAERVSHFKPLLDNLRLTRIHSMLVGRRLLPLPHKRLVAKTGKPDLSLLRHPGKVLRMLIEENATPEGLAMSAAIGMFLAVLPLLFLHTVVILYVSLRLNLNKIVSLNVQHLAMPPFVPAVCIEVGYYLRHGQWLTDLSFATVFAQFSSRLYEWFLGSLIVGPVLAVVVGGLVFGTAAAIRKARCSYAPKEGC
jgi:glycosyltransferase involved in cell wall biosynthesis